MEEPLTSLKPKPWFPDAIFSVMCTEQTNHFIASKGSMMVSVVLLDLWWKYVSVANL
jgi:hypothetical protein